MGPDPKQKTRRSVPQGKKLFENNLKHEGSEDADWTALDSGRILEIIGIVTSRGGAIRFGYTRDGKALSVGVYIGDQRDTLYLRPGGDIEEIFSLIEGTFQNFPVTGGRAPE